MTQDAAADAARPRRPLVLDADGGTALALGAEPRGADRRGADPLGERRPPRIPFRLLVAALVGVILLTGSAFGTRSLATPDPEAFAIFDEAPTEADARARDNLSGIGAPMLGSPRILATESFASVVVTRAPVGTRDALRLTGGYPPPGGPTSADPLQRGGEVAPVAPVPESAEVCLWILAPAAGPTGRCASVDDFVTRGVVASSHGQSVEIVAHWRSDGELVVESIPWGPSTLDELRALDLPAVELLESLPVEQQAELDMVGALGGYGLEEVVIDPRTVLDGPEGRMVAGVYRPGGQSGLLICTSVDATSFRGGGCTPVPVFVARGASSGFGSDGVITMWSWFADGRAEITVEEDEGFAP